MIERDEARSNEVGILCTNLVKTPDVVGSTNVTGATPRALTTTAKKRGPVIVTWTSYESSIDDAFDAYTVTLKYDIDNALKLPVFQDDPEKLPGLPLPV